MTFKYFPSLPNPPDDPADDVAGMQTNSGSIASIIAVDHVGFNVTGGGEHAQVTFNANNVPSPPVSPPILFTNNPSGLTYPQLFFYSGNASQSSNQYSNVATNGSTLLMGGIILKWGSQTFSGTQNPTVTFTHPFPNAIFNIQVSILNAGAGGAQSQPANIILTQSVSGFTARVSSVGLSGNITWYWVAIGN